MADEQIIGTHSVRIDGDTVITRYIGVPEDAHVRAIHRHFDAVLAEHGHVFIINDMRRSGVPTIETRRWIVGWARGKAIRGVVNFGASAPVRMLQNLLFRAAALLGKMPVKNIVNCDSEAEAFARITAWREQSG